MSVAQPPRAADALCAFASLRRLRSLTAIGAADAERWARFSLGTSFGKHGRFGDWSIDDWRLVIGDLGFSSFDFRFSIRSPGLWTVFLATRHLPLLLA